LRPAYRDLTFRSVKLADVQRAQLPRSASEARCKEGAAAGFRDRRDDGSASSRTYLHIRVLRNGSDGEVRDDKVRYSASAPAQEGAEG